MTITFDLPPDIADRLDQKAAQGGQDIAEFLRQLAVREANEVESGEVTESRKPGLHSGWYWIADDFDSPLPDNFWTGA